MSYPKEVRPISWPLASIWPHVGPNYVAVLSQLTSRYCYLLPIQDISRSHQSSFRIHRGSITTLTDLQSKESHKTAEYDSQPP